MALANEEARAPLPHAALSANHQGVERVAPVGGVASGRLFLHRLFDQEQRQVATKTGFEAEKGAGLFKPAVDLRLDLEIPKRNVQLVFEVTDLAGEFKTFADQMQDAAVRRLREDQEFGERVRQAGPSTPTIDPKVIEKLRALGYVQ